MCSIQVGEIQMKKAKTGLVTAGFILAAGVSLGFGGCNKESLQESTTQAVSSQTKENVVQQPTEENAGLAEEKILQALNLWAVDFMENGALEKSGLAGKLWEDASLSYTVPEISEETAVLRYYIATADLGIYVMDETVQFMENGAGYQVESLDVHSYTSIEDGQEFAQLHGASGITTLSTGYSTAYFRGIIRSMIENQDSYVSYKDPIEAAVTQLHLGPGKGGLTQTVDAPVEGTVAMVRYTFDQDGSVVEIPMQLIEATQGIWAPADGNWVRTVYKEASSIQSSSYGLYGLEGEKRANWYPYYISPSAPIIMAEDMVYFMADSQHTEDNLDYQPDCVAILNPETGVVDMESMKLPQEALDYKCTDFGYYGNGFLCMRSEEKHGYYWLPLVNTGTAVSGEEVDRTKILANPGKVWKISKRTMTETYAHIDLDGDGISEKVILSGSGFDMPYDEMKLQIDDSVLEEPKWSLHNDIFAVSLDGKEILLVLLEDGPSADYSSTFYGYRNGELVTVGEMPGHAHECVIEDGNISSMMRSDLLQSDYIKAKWHVGADGLLQMVPQDSYEYVDLNDITLKVALPVHSKPDVQSEKYEIQPQTVQFLKTDATFSWVYVQVESGETGWVLVEGYGYVKELDMSADDVFDNLLQFG